MAGENFNDHFTPGDRRELIETGVKLNGLLRDFGELKIALAVRDTDHKRDHHQAEQEQKKLLDQLESEANKRLDQMDQRIRILENFRWWIVGAAAASGAIGSFIGKFFHV